ncbi:MAG: NAD(P)H-hydrate dehydratase [Acidobacteria bacterium]|nr:NAD(P)H-hydrate dehydratase [Acidobacteriota bacterium]
MDTVFTAEQMREADSKTIERLNGNGLLLMEHASAACVRELFARFGTELRGMQVVVLAGRGNNGGDGLAIARQLVSRGISVTVIVLGGMGKISDDASYQLKLLGNYNISTVNEPDMLSPETVNGICNADLIVDAMLGTGMKSSPRGVIGEVILLLKKCRGFILSVDVPSGLDSDCGVVPGEAVHADLTVTFGKLKRCHVLSPSCLRCGEIVVDDITIPEDVFDSVGADCFLLEKTDIASRLPELQADGHKGTFGHVLVAAGAPGRLGACVMAGRAALRSGSGLVTVHLHRDSYSIVGPMAPELMVFLADKPYSAAVLSEALAGKDALVAGPGFGTTESAHDAMAKLLSAATIPTVLDADVFRIFKVDELASVLDSRPAILTPHPGEMAVFHETTVSEIQQNRIGFAVETAKRTGAVTVLKGHRTIIATPDGNTFVNPTGNAGLATAGSGDVLSGIAGSFLGQGMTAMDAAICAVYVHGLAGEFAGETLTMRGVTAPAILNAIPNALHAVVEEIK